MIALTRISGSMFLLNADLIERVDATPDTVISLVDGKKYVVAESISAIREAVIAYRAEIVSRRFAAEDEAVPAARRTNERPAHLAAVPLKPDTIPHPPDHGGDR